MKYEEYFKNLTKKITDYFQKSKKEESDKISAFFSKLKHSLNEKQTDVGIWEKEIISGESDFDRDKERLDELLTELKNINVNELPPRHDIESFKKDKGVNKSEEGNNLTNAYRRKKHTVNYKLSNLERNLAQKIKENNDAINEENRNYKNRIAEFTRRQNIDIQRSVDANIKAYGDIEKQLLETNDPKEIIEAKKRIKKIRIAGMKEQMNIKNKYALMLYENALNYKKFYEKRMLEHALITEDFTLKIKDLEVEKREIKNQETCKLDILEYELHKQLLELEKENELAKINSQRKIHEQINSLKKQIIGVDIKKRNYLREKVVEKEKDIFSFDCNQLSLFKKHHSFFNNQLDNDLIFLYQIFVKVSENFFRWIGLLIEEKCQLRNQWLKELKDYLFIGNKNKIFKSAFVYENVFSEIKKILEKFIEQQSARIKELVALANKFSLEIMVKTKEAMDEIQQWCRVEEQSFHQLEHQYSEILSQGCNNSIEANESAAQNDVKNVALLMKDIEKEEAEKEKYFSKIHHRLDFEYQNKIVSLDNKIKDRQEEIKKIIIQDQKNYNAYKKKSRYRINQYKYTYHQNVAKHEKLLNKQYKEQLQENELERQRKIKTL